MTYTRNAAFEVNDLDDGVVLFDAGQQVLHHLNGPATLVWELVEGRDFETVTDAVARVLEVDTAQAADITTRALDQFRAIGAIAG
ncbi:MAG TPA: PqqD family protein [Propioniciclava sp.]|jgi:hypothetical protein|uniref:PqqD family protein n=1 Tax=Propioniciclava sp. TaxID=2038686 RepID=UPI002C2EB07A|nr:PqqD family protein [Propioniciclava sp.]HRL50180.1 PqqD family protein [Propioniciclava sp.]HRL81120.1 PqqD family protein [Propioniciclava sp.]